MKIPTNIWMCRMHINICFKSILSNSEINIKTKQKILEGLLCVSRTYNLLIEFHDTEKPKILADNSKLMIDGMILYIHWTYVFAHKKHIFSTYFCFCFCMCCVTVE